MRSLLVPEPARSLAARRAGSLFRAGRTRSATSPSEAIGLDALRPAARPVRSRRSAREPGRRGPRSSRRGASRRRGGPRRARRPRRRTASSKMPRDGLLAPKSAETTTSSKIRRQPHLRKERREGRVPVADDEKPDPAARERREDVRARPRKTRQCRRLPEVADEARQEFVGELAARPRARRRRPRTGARRRASPPPIDHLSSPRARRAATSRHVSWTAPRTVSSDAETPYAAKVSR